MTPCSDLLSFLYRYSSSGGEEGRRGVKVQESDLGQAWDFLTNPRRHFGPEVDGRRPGGGQNMETRRPGGFKEAANEVKGSTHWFGASRVIKDNLRNSPGKVQEVPWRRGEVQEVESRGKGVGSRGKGVGGGQTPRWTSNHVPVVSSGLLRVLDRPGQVILA